ncbi:hypothetical protein OSTOST_11312 [Ostertagia ostertagi]
MSGGTYCDEDAEVRVGVVVRPLRGHWKPAKGSALMSQSSDQGTQLDGSIWKTSSSDYDNMANMQFTSQMVYSRENLVGTDSRSLPTTDSGSLNNLALPKPPQTPAPEE